MKKFSSTMKANSRRTSPSRQRIVTIVVVTVLLLMALFIVPRAVHVVTGLIVAPVTSVKAWVQTSSASLPTYLRDRAVLVEEMTTLRQQIADRGGDRFTADMLVKENAQLRSLLGDGDDARILAGVIGRPNTLPYDMVMIDQGRVDGIVEGAPVYIGERTVIGFVQSTTDFTALVTLITTPDFSSTVFVIGPDIYATAVGVGGGQVRVGVPQGIEIAEGDLVILPSVASGIYGAVTHIESTPTQPEQYAYVAPKIPIASLRLVSVGTDPLQGVDAAGAAENVEVIQNELFSVDAPLVYYGSGTATTTSSSTTAATTTTHE